MLESLLRRPLRLCVDASLSRPLRRSILSIWNLTFGRRFLTSVSSADNLSSRSLTSLSSTSSADTVFAVSSGFGKSAVGVVRVSGRGAADALRNLLRRRSGAAEKDVELASNGEEGHPLPPRMASVRRIFHPKDGRQLDRCLCLFFPNPNSYTGEDSFELHVHGGAAVLRSVLDALSGVVGLRHAAPGEFTKRAFINGKIDLAAAEGVADLVNAETEAQQTLALHQLEGSLSRLYASWSSRLRRQLALLEASVDFAEDNQLEVEEAATMEGAFLEAGELRAEMRRHLEEAERGKRMRDGVKVVIAGKPNAGKSSLLNRLLRREAAIVTPLAGTTRDVIEGFLNLEGFPVVFSDTAGLREEDSATDPVEREGVSRAKTRISEADVVVVVVDVADVVDDKEWTIDSHLRQLGFDPIDSSPQTPRRLLVINKTDLLPSSDHPSPDLPPDLATRWPPTAINVSCITGSGVSRLESLLAAAVADLCGVGSGEGGVPNALKVVATRARHREHVRACVAALEDCLRRREEEEEALVDASMVADDLGVAVAHLGRITGVVRTDDILDIVFKEFCVGK